MEQTNLYYSESGLTAHDSAVLRADVTHEHAAIALLHNIVRPAGGGEPSDRGVVRYGGKPIPITSVVKRDGLTWLHLAPQQPLPREGDEVRVVLDAAHRERRRRLHTGVHVVLRSCIDTIGDEAEVTKANILEDASGATFAVRVAKGVATDQIDAIARTLNRVVMEALPVDALKAKSVDEARRIHGPRFRLSERHALSGKVRLIRIGDFDVNPCAGLHWKDTAIGPCNLRIEATADGLCGVLRIDGTG